jgi:hypothetical protein
MIAALPKSGYTETWTALSMIRLRKDWWWLDVSDLAH